ncbi:MULTISPECIES: helix-turn-helix domain-containing protein [unclassified Paenibacillus]|uniref:helix-turn-helix domain-containing protein n=1 Tax=unclassified Paenibacillus TaxID=185978 RepID=UPI0030F773D2
MKLRPSYKPMEITLIRRDKSKTYLRNTLGLSPATIAKMSNGEYVALSVIARICEDLECRIEEVVEFIEDTNTGRAE